MKQHLLFTAFLAFIFAQGFSQAINHVDYGDDGLTIGLNESYEMDIDNDGVIDFKVNSWQDELGFTPIFAIGCFVIDDYYELTSWGSHILTTLQEGDVLSIDGINMYDYLDDDRGSSYKSGEGPAAGWENG